MSEPSPAVESGEELRGCAWQDKCLRSIQRTERRLKVVFWVVAAVFIFAVILYFWSRPLSEPKVLRPVVAGSLSLVAAAQLTARHSFQETDVGLRFAALT